MTDDKLVPLQHRATIADAASSRTVGSGQAWNLRAWSRGGEYTSSSPATVDNSAAAGSLNPVK
jgi:hypothetical protein